ncbi:hypothetical protein D9M68_754320 [compost metagenome]
MGPARRPGPEDVHRPGQDRGGRCQQLQVRLQGALRHGARRAEQAVVEPALHHAGARGRHAGRQADRRRHRLRPLHLQEGRIPPRREDRLPEELQIRAARRGAVGHGRWQERVRRPHGVDRAEGRANAGQCAGQRRGRHDRVGALRAVHRAQEQPRHHARQPRVEGLVRAAPEPPDPALRQPEDRAGGLHGHQPGGADARPAGAQGALQRLRVHLPLRLGLCVGQDRLLHRQAAVRKSQGAAQGGRV